MKAPLPTSEPDQRQIEDSRRIGWLLLAYHIIWIPISARADLHQAGSVISSETVDVLRHALIAAMLNVARRRLRSYQIDRLSVIFLVAFGAILRIPADPEATATQPTFWLFSLIAFPLVAVLYRTRSTADRWGPRQLGLDLPGPDLECAPYCGSRRDRDSLDREPSVHCGDRAAYVTRPQLPVRVLDGACRLQHADRIPLALDGAVHMRKGRGVQLRHNDSPSTSRTNSTPEAENAKLCSTSCFCNVIRLGRPRNTSGS